MSVAEPLRRTSAPPRFAAAWRARPRRGVVIDLLVAAVILGCISVLARADLGSGDYGQWLMAARPYVGEQMPAYRLDAAIPPVVPFVLGMATALVPDRIMALHFVAVLLLAALGIAAYLCAFSLFRRRIAGVAAVVAALLLTDAFLELFAFGGLLQAGAIVWLWISVAASAAGMRQPERTRWWVLGAAAVGGAALTHVGTASIAVPVGIAAAVLAATASSATVAQATRRLRSLAGVLAVVAVFWLVVLLPGGTELARNPASLNYRGPDRLWESLTSFAPTLVVASIGLGAIAIGLAREWRERSIGPWSILGAWTGVTAAVVLTAIVTQAATDYPRFATPILAPLVIAASGPFAWAVTAAAVAIRRRVRGFSTRSLAAAVMTAVILVTVPWSVGRFEAQIAGYGLRDASSLAAVSAWIERQLPAGATILAPVREAKWIEGLSGRATLFNGAIRYSFRSEEWERGFAADTLLRTAGAVVNQSFFVGLTDADATTGVPRSLTIGANHGGEYLDLVRTVPTETAILGITAETEPIARLANLAADRRQDGSRPGEARVTLRWAGERYGEPVTMRQTIGLRPTASTLELIYGATSGLPSAGFVVTMRPAPGAIVTGVTSDSGEAVLTYGVMGATAPQLRFTVSGDAVLDAADDGTLTLRSDGRPLRLLVTDLTASVSPEIPLQVLRPADLLDRYGIEAVVLPRDGVYEARRARLEALGFRSAAELGPYSILRLSPGVGGSEAP